MSHNSFSIQLETETNTNRVNFIIFRNQLEIVCQDVNMKYFGKMPIIVCFCSHCLYVWSMSHSPNRDTTLWRYNDWQYYSIISLSYKLFSFNQKRFLFFFWILKMNSFQTFSYKRILCSVGNTIVWKEKKNQKSFVVTLNHFYYWVTLFSSYVLYSINKLTICRCRVCRYSICEMILFARRNSLFDTFTAI